MNRDLVSDEIKPEPQITKNDLKKLQEYFLKREEALLNKINFLQAEHQTSIENLKDNLLHLSKENLTLKEKLNKPTEETLFNFLTVPMQSDKIDELYKALIKARPNMGRVAKGGVSGYNMTQFKEAAEQALADQGVAITQGTWGDFLYSDITHTSGQFKRSVVRISDHYDPKKRATDPQKQHGATKSYLSKYLYRLQTGIEIED